MYYRPDSNQVFTDHSAIRAALTNVLFGSVITDDALIYNGVFPLVYQKPEPPNNQIAVPDGIKMVNDMWTQQWKIRDVSDEEVEAIKPPVPASVTRRQARQALLLRGMLENVPAAIQNIADETQRGLAQIEWEDSQTFERHRPLVIEIGAAIGLDDAGLDALFIEAARL